MKTVTILLTKYSDWLGRFVCLISKNPYSHASISTDGSVFYSFNKKGFAIECPKKWVPKKQLPGHVCIHMQVPEETYASIGAEINQFLNRRNQYAYSWWGVVLCLLHIPHKFQDRYFCSQFVAEVLLRSGAAKLKKKESLYLPGQLLDEIDCPYANKQLVYNAI